MNTTNIPGFTATSSLGKSTISYRQFGSMNFRRPSSPIEPQLMISNPFLLGELVAGGWAGWGSGGDWDVPMPIDPGPSGDGSPHSEATCRANCWRKFSGNTRLLKECLWDCS